MYTKFFGLTKKPFSLIPDPSFLYLSPKHKKALTTLQYGLVSHAGFTVVTGEVGSGKTTLLLSVLETMKGQAEIGLITNTHSEFGDLLTWVFAAFDIKSDATNKAERYKIFVDFVTKKCFGNKRVVLVVDEAQNMDIQTLEELRLLSNININQQIMLQLVLVGQPELVEKLNKPELLQFSQRVSIEYHLKPLSYDETVLYIQHRLKIAGTSEAIFYTSACAALFYYSGGVPRLINNLGDLALVFAFAAEKKRVDWKIISEVAKERSTGGIKRFEGKVVLTNNLLERAAASEHFRRDLLELTGIDISKTM